MILIHLYGYEKIRVEKIIDGDNDDAIQLNSSFFDW